MKGWEITDIWIYFQLLNNFKKIWDLLNERSFFLYFIASPPSAGAAISWLFCHCAASLTGSRGNFVKKRDCFSIVHNDKIRDCHAWTLKRSGSQWQKGPAFAMRGQIVITIPKEVVAISTLLSLRVAFLQLRIYFCLIF